MFPAVGQAFGFDALTIFTAIVVLLIYSALWTSRSKFRDDAAGIGGKLSVGTSTFMPTAHSELTGFLRAAQDTNNCTNTTWNEVAQMAASRHMAVF